MHEQETMLNRLVDLCTSGNGLFWLVLGSDLSIAAAYFAIPVTMAVVLRDRKDDIPYPWLWLLFVTFIVACGMTHVVHASSAIASVEFLWAQAAIGVFCAVASVGTAVAFALTLPQIKMLPSPQQQRAELERLVAQRSAEKDQLIREINHRVGNQLQIISSVVSVESRNAQSQEAIEILGRVKAQLAKMGHEHHERSKADYLRYGIGAVDGTITPTAPSASSSETVNALQSKPLTA